ncbi:Uncharacterised protein [Mycobacteroides abscessus subsp. abscessus]|nr:Uncharacterised protein [Mycobacteroides abscessus subsp. abscessus]
MVSSTCAIERAEIASSSREATSSESASASSDSSRSTSSTVTCFPFESATGRIEISPYLVATIAECYCLWRAA